MALSPVGSQSVVSGVFQGVILGLILVNVFSNGLDNGMDCTLGIFADDIKLGRVDGTPDGCTTIQKHLERLEKWTNRNLMKLVQ